MSHALKKPKTKFWSLKTLKKLVLPSILLLGGILAQNYKDAKLIKEWGLLDMVDKASKIAIIAAICWGLIVAIRTTKKLFLQNFDISAEDNLRYRKFFTQYNIFEKILNFLIIFMGIAASLMLFEEVRQVGVSLLGTAGVTGIIVGLAAQKIIGSVLAGLQLAITQPIRLDDALLVENEWGWVEEINLTYVVIRLWDKRRLVLPTTYFIEKPFQNWTRTSADIMGTIFLHTDYSVDFDAMRAELTRILNNTDLWDGRVNVLQVTDAKERTVETRLLVSARNSPTAWDLRVHVREKMIEFLQKNYPESLPRTRIIFPEKTGGVEGLIKDEREAEA